MLGYSLAGWDLVWIVPAGDYRLHDLMNETVGRGVIISESLKQDLIVYDDHAIGTAAFGHKIVYGTYSCQVPSALLGELGSIGIVPQLSQYAQGKDGVVGFALISDMVNDGIDKACSRTATKGDNEQDAIALPYPQGGEIPYGIPGAVEYGSGRLSGG